MTPSFDDETPPKSIHNEIVEEKETRKKWYNYAVGRRDKFLRNEKFPVILVAILFLAVAVIAGVAIYRLGQRVTLGTTPKLLVAIFIIALVLWAVSFNRWRDKSITAKKRRFYLLSTRSSTNTLAAICLIVLLLMTYPFVRVPSIHWFDRPITVAAVEPGKTAGRLDLLEKTSRETQASVQALDRSQAATEHDVTVLKNKVLAPTSVVVVTAPAAPTVSPRVPAKRKLVRKQLPGGVPEPYRNHHSIVVWVAK